MKSVANCFLFLLVLGFVLVPNLQAQRERLPRADLDFVEKTWPDAKKTVTSIRYIVLKEGSGPMAKPGDKVSVLYEGRLIDGTVFDQAKDPTMPFTFRVRRNMVIEGWDQIVQQMRAGEKRLVIIPAELAYGTRGQPPKIGRNATLVFEMEILSISEE